MVGLVARLVRVTDDCLVVSGCRPGGTFTNLVGTCDCADNDCCITVCGGATGAFTLPCELIFLHHRQCSLLLGHSFFIQAV